jgi:hypothetical protein
MDTTVVATINHSVVIIEAVIGVVVVLLLIAIIVTNHRRKKAAAPRTPEAVPNYYADLQSQPAGRPDPFSTFASAASPSVPPSAAQPGTHPGDIPPGGYSGERAAYPGPLTSAFADAVSGSGLGNAADAVSGSGLGNAATAAAFAQTPSPPAGTPAGWLPDPGGAPDTLRYWDGNAWTQHFAQRS